MGRQEDLMALSYNQGLKEYKFWLDDNTGSPLEVEYAPDGWLSTKIPTYERNSVYKGVIRKASSVTLDFPKDGKDYLDDAWTAEGINADVICTVKKLDLSTYTYVDYFIGLCDFSTYKSDEVFVNIQIIDTSFVEKFKNRDQVEVNLYDLVSIEGFGITPLSTELMVLTFPEYVINAEAAFDRYPTSPFSDNHILPSRLTGSEFDEATTPAAWTPISAKANALFFEADQARTMVVEIAAIGVLQFSSSHLVIRADIWMEIRDSSDVQISRTHIADIDGSSTTIVNFNISDTQNVSLLTGYSIVIQFEVAIPYPSTFTVDYSSIAIVIREEISNIAEQERRAHPVYEALLRNLQIMLDADDVLISNYFGRDDTPIRIYSSDGEIAHIAKGLLIRGNTISNSQINVNFRELFQSLSAIHNLGLGIEGTQIRVENLEYFFEATVVLDLSNRVNAKSIEHEALPDWHYNSINAGYSSFVYGNVGGLYEYNTKSVFSTVIRTIKSALNIVSKYRGDTGGINLLRETGITENPSEDVDGDGDIFILQTARDGADFVVKTDADFEIVSGGVDAGQSYNLDYSPNRNLRRHGMNIRAGLEKQLNTYLKYMVTDKNTNLVTKKYTEANSIIEAADILVDDLDEPLWHPEALIFEAPLTADDLADIDANLKGLIKVSDTEYGWILKLEPSADGGLAKIVLLWADLTYVTPV